MSEDEEQFEGITVNGVTYRAPKAPDPEPGQTVSVSTTILTGRRCPRCFRVLTASKTKEGGIVEGMPVIEHTEEQCNAALVDDTHNL